MLDMLAAQTAQNQAKFLENPTSALILHGPTGVGKQAVADEMTAQLLGVDSDRLLTHAYVTTIQPDNNSISIDIIRELQKSLIRTVPGSAAVRRVVRIFGAEKLTPEAQNALLKLLEEPPTDTVFLLCVDTPRHLLQTVTSRAQLLAVTPITEAQAYEAFGDTPAVKRAYHMSGGRAALLQALLEDSDHPLALRIAQAKELLSATAYDRLSQVNKLSKDRGEVDDLLEALELVAHVSLRSAVTADKSAQAHQWQHIARQLKQARKSLANNAGAKLVLTDLFLHL